MQYRLKEGGNCLEKQFSKVVELSFLVAEDLGINCSSATVFLRK